MARVVDADYLVVGAGAMGMAFTDALIDHADVRVAILDRRRGVGGHWLDAYPFVRLHQASEFYGVASTPLGEGRLQSNGPEAGLHERASGAEVCQYYSRVLNERFLPSGKVEFFPECDYLGDGNFVSLLSGERFSVRDGSRIVDARYVAPEIPATTPPPFTFDAAATVVPVNDLLKVAEGATQFVIVGSGKTATDACIWLLEQAVDPDAICWVRPRDPWMLNRAVVQPDRAVYLGMAAAMMEAARAATSIDDLFLRLEDKGVLFRLDRSVRPTMARTPTLARWELDHLRSIEHVVRLGHLHHVDRQRLVLTDGEVAIRPGAVVVHCAASGLQSPPELPIWAPEAITLQVIRFPCFAAALIGYVEATRDDDDEKNRLCRPVRFPSTLTDWARFQLQGILSSQAFNADTEVGAWANSVMLNLGRTPPMGERTREVTAALERLAEHTTAGLARLAELADGMP
jgi:hypothetical protein